MAAYAILGPLHYLTEISWLNDRRYYTRGKHDYLVLIALSIVVTVVVTRVFGHIPDWVRVMATYLAFGVALIFVLAGKWWQRLICYAALAVTGIFIIRVDFFYSLFDVLLPTIVHVFIFTGLFILIGALKSRSVPGISSLVVFCLCAGSFFIFGRSGANNPVSAYVQNNYGAFAQLNYSLMTPFSHQNLSVPRNLMDYILYVNYVLYRSPTALAIMRLIAFAYTYHYLNWFSKTSIIQWHNISRSRFIGVIVIWIASVAVYAGNYQFGLRWLFFLSFTHVLLEFPLNHLTLINIGRELKKFVSPVPNLPELEES
ncbi:MAG TPA: hypothetical protein VFV23_05780 [Verrucomicrobiae bacterium]|nr:hypothetical protein [Verrucomicrobiae bacterium]